MTHFLVSRGVLAPPDLYVPMDAVSEVGRESGSVTLGVDSGDVDHLGWSESPSPEGLPFTGRDEADDDADGIDGEDASRH